MMLTVAAKTLRSRTQPSTALAHMHSGTRVSHFRSTSNSSWARPEYQVSYHSVPAWGISWRPLLCFLFWKAAHTSIPPLCHCCLVGQNDGQPGIMSIKLWSATPTQPCPINWNISFALWIMFFLHSRDYLPTFYPIAMCFKIHCSLASDKFIFYIKIQVAIGSHTVCSLMRFYIFHMHRWLDIIPMWNGNKCFNPLLNLYPVQ